MGVVSWPVRPSGACTATAAMTGASCQKPGSSHYAQTAPRGRSWMPGAGVRAYGQRRVGASRSPMVMPLCTNASTKATAATVASMNVLARPSADNDGHHVRARSGMAPCCDVGPARCHARRSRTRCSQAGACALHDLTRGEFGAIRHPRCPRRLRYRAAQYLSRIGHPASLSLGCPPKWEVVRRRADSELTPPGWISGAALEEAGRAS
jgi:hypothetical protein